MHESNSALTLTHPIFAPYRNIIVAAHNQSGVGSPTRLQHFVDCALIPAATARLRVQPDVQNDNFPLETITVEGSEIRMMREIFDSKNADEERAAIKRHSEFVRIAKARGADCSGLHTQTSWSML